MAIRRYYQITAVLITLAIIVSVYFATLVILWDDYISESNIKNRILTNDSFENTKGLKTVLIWNGMFGNKWYYLGDSNHFDDCPVHKNCLLTPSRDYLPNITSWDGILFHSIELIKDDLPIERKVEQIYMFGSLESPSSRPINDNYYDGYYNATMTYRLDSDLPKPYNVIRCSKTGKIVAPLADVKWPEPIYENLTSPSILYKDYEKNFHNKSKIAAWLVSHCNTHSKREIYVEDMKKHVPIDIFGKCAKYDDDDDRGKKCLSKDCFSNFISKEYLFYLSFENTMCKDYVTEKFYNAMRYDIIPVVYGGANYSLFAPPHSYIDALDFESPEALANYLIELSKDRDEYLKYFWWKRFYYVDETRSYVLCRLCELLNEPLSKKVYSPLNDWYSKGKCPMQDLLANGRFATKKTRDRVIGKT